MPLLLLLWLFVTAPLSRSLQPQEAQSIVLLDDQGEVIARRGAIIEEPVRIEALPDHVWQAFLAIEDRRFYRHRGLDGRGLVRAGWRNLAAGGVREGGSTVTQQLAKQSFLNSDRTVGRKLQEMLLALWLEARLSKDQILERYLSAIYFGDNVYGLRAAARHYFSKEPEALAVGEAALLAGLVKAPSRLSPTTNPGGARQRARLVVRAMADAGVLAAGEADRVPIPRPRPGRLKDAPSGSYFADWVLGAAPDLADRPGRHVVRTTLDSRLQDLAEAAVARAPLGGAQVALVAMRPDGRVVAMVGGRSYAQSPFNRATQARRQPGSTFKLFVYLAALRQGMTPVSPLLDAPVEVDGWSPANADGRYRGPITLREAFAVSSNAATVRLAEEVGLRAVVRTARAFGVESELAPQPSLALGASAVNLLEMTAAYAGVAGNRFPVRPHGLAGEAPRPERLDRLDERRELPMMLDLLWSAANEGTGRAAALPVPTFGKTGTTQNSRDAIFIGFAEDLVTAVWVGNDDNSPLGGVAGGGLPAALWRDFMARALGIAAPGRPAPAAAAPRAAAPRTAGAARGLAKQRGKKKRKRGRR